MRIGSRSPCRPDSQIPFGMSAESAGYQLGPFEKRQIKAHAHHGLSAAAISRIVTKPDGTYFTDVTMLRTVAKINGDPAWRGERQTGSGRLRKTTVKLDGKITKMVLKRRGEERVTVSALRKQLPELRSCSRTLVEERLHEAGMLYLRGRKKFLVPKKYKEDRLAFASWVMRRHDSTLEQCAYSDGTVFYLERTQEENEHGHRRSLGSSVWRRADLSDALYEDCVGPRNTCSSLGFAGWRRAEDFHFARGPKHEPMVVRMAGREGIPQVAWRLQVHRAGFRAMPALRGAPGSHEAHRRGVGTWVPKVVAGFKRHRERLGSAEEPPRHDKANLYRAAGGFHQKASQRCWVAQHEQA